MVRFIINKRFPIFPKQTSIYIPIWLDLLYGLLIQVLIPMVNLHSNMVRFIMKKRVFNLMYNEKIYIPIWLDLLFQISI